LELESGLADGDLKVLNGNSGGKQFLNEIIILANFVRERCVFRSRSYKKLEGLC